MKVTNETEWPIAALRRLIRWAWKQMEMPIDKLPKLVVFKRSRGKWHGQAMVGGPVAHDNRVTCWVGKYPWARWQTHRQKRCLETRTHEDSLVFLLAHELFHVRQDCFALFTRERRFDRRYQRKLEVEADSFGLFVLRQFQKDAGDLVLRWGLGRRQR